MENLNAETVKKDLKELMYEAYASNGAHKPYLTMRDALALITSQEQRIKELAEEVEMLTKAKYIFSTVDYCADDLAKALEENKRLTEENERLRAENEGYEAEHKQSFFKWKKLADETADRYENLYQDAKKSLIADTVRKMQERLKAEMSFGRYIQADQIDQIAKEMLEGKDG